MCVFRVGMSIFDTHPKEKKEKKEKIRHFGSEKDGNKRNGTISYKKNVSNLFRNHAQRSHPTAKHSATENLRNHSIPNYFHRQRNH